MIRVCNYYPSGNVQDRHGRAEPHLFGHVLLLYGGGKPHVVVADSIHSRVGERSLERVLRVES